MVVKKRRASSQQSGNSKARQSRLKSTSEASPQSKEKSEVRDTAPKDSPSSAVKMALPPPTTRPVLESFPGPELPRSAPNSGVVAATTDPDRQLRLNSLVSGKTLLLGRTKPRQPRKLVVRSVDADNVASQPPTSSKLEYYADMKGKLQRALDTIFTTGKLPYDLSQEELYRGVENMCRFNQAADLGKMCLDTVKSYSRKLLGNVTKRDNEFVMDAVLAEYQLWTSEITLARNIFYYLDRSYLLEKRGDYGSGSSESDSTFSKLGEKLFFEKVLDAKSMGKRLVSEVVAAVASQYEHGHLDGRRDSIVKLVKVLESTKTFELPLFELQSGLSDYLYEIYQNGIDVDIVAFVDLLQQRVVSQRKLVDDFGLPTACIHYFLDATHTAMLGRGHGTVIRGEVGTLIIEGYTARFAYLYNVHSHIHELDAFIDAVRSFSISRIRHILASRVNEGATVVDDLVAFHKRGADLVVAVREHEKLAMEHYSSPLAEALRAAFAAALKDDGPIMAELLASYLDGELRKRHPDGELEEKLDGSMVLFKLLDQPSRSDIFENLYRRQLSKRLLGRKSSSIADEEATIARFKAESAGAFTSRLETMIKDMEQSDEYGKQFRQSTEKVDVDFGVSVLTQEQWPSTPDLEIKLPAEVQGAIQAFTDFYEDKHEKRVLTWNTTMANCVMTANFPSGPKELYLGAHQVVVLMLFDEDTTSLSFEQIQVATKIPPNVLKRTLQSLACAQYKILSKTPASHQVEVTDSFAFNEDFESEETTIKIGQIRSHEEDIAPAAGPVEVVQRDRTMELRAAVSRIMKRERTQSHDQLVAQIIHETARLGAPKTEEIKGAIDHSLEREYIERSKQDSSVYVYIM